MTTTFILNSILYSPNRVTCVPIAKYLCLLCVAYFMSDKGILYSFSSMIRQRCKFFLYLYLSLTWERRRPIFVWWLSLQFFVLARRCGFSDFCWFWSDRVMNFFLLCLSLYCWRCRPMFVWQFPLYFILVLADRGWLSEIFCKRVPNLGHYFPFPPTWISILSSSVPHFYHTR